MSTAPDDITKPGSQAEAVEQLNTPSPIAQALDRFLSSVDDIRDALRHGLPAVADHRIKEIDQCLSTLKKFQSAETETSATFTANNAHDASELLSAREDFDRLSQSRSLIVFQRSLFIGLFSAFDAFLGAMLAALFVGKPELFHTIKREIALEDLLTYPDLQAVKIDLLEKEIEDFRRESYITQFETLESKFEMRTLRQFKEWPTFVEMAQRRNQ